MQQSWAGCITAVLLIGAATLIGLWARLNTAGEGFLLLLAVLLTASRWPLWVATVAAVLATLSYNFFFFTPVGTLRVEDPANWIALSSFLAASLLANRLLARERRQAAMALASRSQVEALYGLSLELLRGRSGLRDAGEAAVRSIRSVGAVSGGVVLFGTSPQQQQVVAWTGDPPGDDLEDVMAGVGRHRRVEEIPSRFGRDLCIPLSAGGRVSGVLAARGTNMSRAVLESIATLVAFAVERELFIMERAHLEALRESNEIKTSLLQAVSHDLNSPLTVLTVETEALARELAPEHEMSRRVAAIREQTAQLQRRIGNLLSLARFEAGIVNPHREPTPVADLFRSARESVAMVVQARPLQTSVALDTPYADVDPSLALEIVVNLIENAHRISPPGQAVELASERSPEDPSRVWIEVRDRGPGFSPSQQKALRRIGFSDSDSRGLGIELVRRLAQLSGGTVEWFPREGGGTIARVDLPAAALLAGEEAP